MTELKLAGVGSDTPVRRPIDWRAPITLSVVAVLGFVVFGLLGRDKSVTFSWASRGVPTFIPDWVANSQVVGLATGVLMLVIAVYATWLAVQRRRVPGWFVAIFALGVATIVVVGNRSCPDAGQAGIIDDDPNAVTGTLEEAAERV